MTASTHPQRILLAGTAAGYSDPLKAALLNAGHSVSTVLGHRADISAAVALITDDACRSRTLLAHEAADADVVVLLTGLGSLSNLVSDSKSLDVLLSHMRPGATLVYTSDLAIFGQSGDEPVDETTAPVVPPDMDPQRACEVRVLAAADWLRTIVVRTGFVFGVEGEDFLAHAIQLAAREGTSRYYGEPTDQYPTIHVDDVVRLLVAVADPNVPTGIYHAATGSVRARSLGLLIARLAGVDRVEPWDPDDFARAYGLPSPPPRVDVAVAEVLNTDALDWTPYGEQLSEALLRSLGSPPSDTDPLGQAEPVVLGGADRRTA